MGALLGQKEGGKEQREEEENEVDDEDCRLPVPLSLFLLHSSQCRPSVWAPPPVIGVSSLIWAGLLWRACPVGCRRTDTVRCYLSGPPDSSATAGGSPAGERGGATHTQVRTQVKKSDPLCVSGVCVCVFICSTGCLMALFH